MWPAMHDKQTATVCLCQSSRAVCDARSASDHEAICLHTTFCADERCVVAVNAAHHTHGQALDTMYRMMRDFIVDPNIKLTAVQLHSRPTSQLRVNRNKPTCPFAVNWPCYCGLDNMPPNEVTPFSSPGVGTVG